MVHYFIGQLGHLFVITAFVSAMVATYSYYRSSQPNPQWDRFSKIIFYFHAFSVLGVLVTLFLIINRHYFEYHYAWNYSSKFLPIYYQISSFWNGQEGSFLLWMFWNVVLGLVIAHTRSIWKAPVMTIMSLSQVFLASMVLGTIFFDIKIGSSPFLLLRDVIQDNIFKINPEFVPEDGSGLNPLLQNYWMVIHPPVLFLGFASTVIPFAYAIAGVWKGLYKEWVRPALPWTQFSALTLGVGILMGAYWAYETLNFGGYWNWDPVENAIYVPWLTLAAGMHTMIAYRKNPTALKSSIILIIITFILILYSTFLTRSGVLGETSVHSFTDLGLSGQLLIYLLLFFIGSILLLAFKWKRIPSSDEEVSVYSREFWIFMGATVLGIMALQVIVMTSVPVWNEIIELFGGTSNLAPPVDQVGYYTKYQFWGAILLAILSGTGQFFWWKKIDAKVLKAELRTPVIFTLLISAIIFLFANIHDWKYLIFLTCAIYSLVANVKILLGLKRTNLKLSGGAITHIGVALMLIGILFSSGYSKILSVNYTGMIWKKDFPDEVNQNNLLLFLNEPRQMADYSLLYRGMRKLTKELGYVPTNYLMPTDHPLKLRVIEDYEMEGNILAKAGDTLHITNNENSYFEVVYTKSNGKEFRMYPRVQMNEQMGVVYSPDINRTLTADLYTHVRTFPDPEQEIEWGEMELVTVPIGERFFVNDYVATFEGVESLADLPNVNLGPEDVAVKAIISIAGEYETYRVEPVYVIKDKMAGKVPDVSGDLASKITIQSIQPEENSFTFGIQTGQKDWIIIEAVEKPWINVLWLGTLLLAIGFSVAMVRRYDEFRKMRDKGQEA
jgi:cytochrome c-type biogenesis protein CcmF